MSAQVLCPYETGKVIVYVL